MERGYWLGCGIGMRELRRFGGAFERRCSCFAACDCLLDRVEVAGADEALVLQRFVAILLGTEFPLPVASCMSRLQP